MRESSYITFTRQLKIDRVLDPRLWRGVGGLADDFVRGVDNLIGPSAEPVLVSASGILGGADDIPLSPGLRNRRPPGLGTRSGAGAAASEAIENAAGPLLSTSGEGSASSSSSGLSPQSQEVFEQIREGVESGDFTVKPNPLNSETLQENNVSIDFGDGSGVNLRTETHPLERGGEPVRHTNVEITRKTRSGRNRVTKNIHITE